MRKLKYFWQKISRGFSDKDTWNLDYTIAKFTLPRLKRFKELGDAYPGCLKSMEEWREIQDKIIWSMEQIVSDNIEADDEKMQEGLELFGKWFNYLWW